MSDQRLSRMLHRAGEEPSNEFVSTLRRDLLAGFGDTVAAAPPVGDPREDRDFGAPIWSNDGYVTVQKPPSAPHRRRWPLLAAAAVLATIATVAVVTRRHAPDALAPSTTPERSFSQRIDVDVHTPAGAIVHVDGTVALPQAVESNESSSQPVHDVLLLPDVSATFTNVGLVPMTIAQASVEIFLRGDRTGCIVNGSVCDSAVTIAAPEDATPAALGPREVLQLQDAGRSSRISVPAGEVPFAIDQVRDGSMVVGFAIVVRAGAASDDTASVVFDRTGRAVLKCAGTPDSCLGPKRAALGDDAAPARSATVPGADAGLPPGALAPGIHASAEFRIPITFTTSRIWDGMGDLADGIVLRRAAGEPAVLVQEAAIVVLRATAERQTVSDVLSTSCAGSLDLSAPSEATLVDKAALTVTSLVSADCIVFPDLSRDKARRGDTVRITAADIGGGQFLVAVAIATEGNWFDFTNEVDALFASIALA